MQKSRNQLGLATVVIIVSILFFYVMQMSPSPLLLEIKDYYQINNNDMLLNMSASIIFPFIVIACLIGAAVEAKIGTYNLFTLAAVLVIAGGLINLIAVSYALLLAGRAIFGLGFGFGVPFIGSAIMKYYKPDSREKMNTVNGLFPFVGTVISFLLAAPISKYMGGFKISLAIWAIPTIIMLIIWLLVIREKNILYHSPDEEAVPEHEEKALYGSLLHRKEIVLLCITFMCDFTCYSYIGVIVPTLFYEATSMSEAMAGIMAAIAFPAFGILGSSSGGIHIAKTGLRKPTLVAAQFGKFIGICIATFGCSHSAPLLIIGIAIFGFCNGLWMPAMYCVPMDLPGMTPTSVGAAFSLLNAFGLTLGFIAPTIGGWVTNMLMAYSGIADATANHVYGLQWSLFIFGFVNLIGAACMLIYKETGIKRSGQPS